MLNISFIKLNILSYKDILFTGKPWWNCVGKREIKNLNAILSFVIDNVSEHLLDVPGKVFHRDTELYRSANHLLQTFRPFLFLKKNCIGHLCNSIQSSLSESPFIAVSETKHKQQKHLLLDCPNSQIITDRSREILWGFLILGVCC